MCTGFDAYRRESQRDFADGVGAMSRALVEGLFWVQPDMLAGELKANKVVIGLMSVTLER
jgi:hypothetical protein